VQGITGDTATIKTSLDKETTMDPLRLSDGLAQDLHATITKHDARAKDPGVAIQYYAAVIGYVLAQQAYPKAQKDEFLQQLFAFSQQVLQDCEQDMRDSQANNAVGKWRPGDS
jgi:hypothetical protein